MRDDEAFHDVRTSCKLLASLIPAPGESQSYKCNEDPSDVGKAVSPSILVSIRRQFCTRLSHTLGYEALLVLQAKC